MRRTAHHLPLTVLLTAMIAGCGGGGDEGTGASLPAIDVQQVVAQTTDFQRELLLDGQLSFAEYEQAVLAALACMEEAGLDVEGPYPRSGDERFLDFRFGGEALAGEGPEAHAGRVHETGHSCMSDYLADVSRVWQAQHLLTPEQREEQRGLVIQCLQDAGIEISTDAALEEVYQAAGEHHEDPAVTRCHDDYPDFFVVGVQ